MADDKLEGENNSVEVEMTPEEMQQKAMNIYATTVKKFVASGLFSYIYAENYTEFKDLVNYQDFAENFILSLQSSNLISTLPYREQPDDSYEKLNYVIFTFLNGLGENSSINRITKLDVMGSEADRRTTEKIIEHFSQPQVMLADAILLIQLSAVSNPSSQYYSDSYRSKFSTERANLYLDFIENNIDRVLKEWQERMQKY